MPKGVFTNSDWEEIYYALARRAEEIEAGSFDDEPGEVDRPGSDTARWAVHLREIMVKVASRYSGPNLP